MGDNPNKIIMGLDMYLTKRTYVQNWSHMAPSEINRVAVKLGGKKHPHIDPKKVSYIIEGVMYWRKDNHIHRWFVENVQDGNDDCKEYWVSTDKIKELIDLCQSVIDKKVNPKDSLPTVDGFFFGSTEYDESYYESLRETIAKLTPILEEANKYQDIDLFYSSSW